MGACGAELLYRANRILSAVDCECPLIAKLAAHFGVEWSAVSND